MQLLGLFLYLVTPVPSSMGVYRALPELDGGIECVRWCLPREVHDLMAGPTVQTAASIINFHWAMSPLPVMIYGPNV